MANDHVQQVKPQCNASQMRSLHFMFMGIITSLTEFEIQHIDETDRLERRRIPSYIPY